MNNESTVFNLFECLGERLDGDRWKDELKMASEAITNPLTETLWSFREVFSRIQKANCDHLCKIWKTSLDDEKDDFFSGHGQCSCKGSLQDQTGDNDVLSPLVNALPHLKLAVPGTLDCGIVGSPWEAFCEFMIRQGRSTFPMSVILDGSAESAWERFLLRAAERQLFLGWHACYAEYRIVTDVRRFAEEVDISHVGELAWRKIGEEGRVRMLKNDFTPSISIANDVASVSCFVFSPFRGLSRIIHEVDMKTGDISPHPIEIETLVKYTCGICF